MDKQQFKFISQEGPMQAIVSQCQIDDKQGEDVYYAQPTTSLDKMAGKSKPRKKRFSFDGLVSPRSPRNNESEDYNTYRAKLRAEERPTYN